MWAAYITILLKKEEGIYLVVEDILIKHDTHSIRVSLNGDRP